MSSLSVSPRTSRWRNAGSVSEMRGRSESKASIVPQCAYLKDHLLVHASDAGRAVALLESLVDDARRVVHGEQP